MFDPALLIIAPIALAAVVASRKGRKWALLVAVLTGTLVVVGQTHTRASGAIPAPMPFLSPQSPPPGCTLPTGIGDTRVISYTYDPLSRLSQAAYSSGECYQYGYDRVGNRTAMTTTVSTTAYQYDNANRLSNAGGVTYTWDNNGNLINDGNALYRYDRANRLISTTLSGATTLFSYNGDGVRLKQIVAGTVTTYTQDVAAPLPVVLQAKTSVTTTKYLYSLGTRPVAQNSTAWEYLLPDALGSVRQIANVNGYIIRTQDYEPYGSVLNSSGSGQSVYGFTGEERDQSGLIFLRARYLRSDLGVFLSRDLWAGDTFRPQSLNGFSYGEENPVNRTDANGLQAQGIVIDCQLYMQQCVALLTAVATGGGTIISGVIVIGGQVLVVGTGVVIVGGIIYDMFHAPPTLPVPPVPAPAPPKPIPTIHVSPIPQPRTADDIARDGGWTGRSPAPNPQREPTPEPNPEPRGPRDPVPWITCTPTEDPQRKHIALGVAEYMFGFWRGLNQKFNPQNIYVYTFDEWKNARLSDVQASTAKGTFGLAFKQATSRAERIHFNLEGIRGDPNDFAEKFGSQGQLDLPGIIVTAAELYLIKHQPGLCAKTDFYETGSTNLTPSLPRKTAICQ
jgi:RHS repeat-associated protein